MFLFLFASRGFFFWRLLLGGLTAGLDYLLPFNFFSMSYFGTHVIGIAPDARFTLFSTGVLSLFFFFFFLIRFFLDFFFIVLVSPSTRARPLCRRFGVSCDGSRMFPRTRASFMRYRVLSRYLFFLFFFFFSLAGGLSRFPPPRRRVILRLWVPFVPFIPVPMMTTAGVVRFIGLRWFSPGSFFCAVVPVFSIGTTRTQPPFLLKWQALIFRMACRDFMCRPILFFVRLEELGVPCFAGVV